VEALQAVIPRLGERVEGLVDGADQGFRPVRVDAFQTGRRAPDQIAELLDERHPLGPDRRGPGGRLPQLVSGVGRQVGRLGRGMVERVGRPDLAADDGQEPGRRHDRAPERRVGVVEAVGGGVHAGRGGRIDQRGERPLVLGRPELVERVTALAAGPEEHERDDDAPRHRRHHQSQHQPSCRPSHLRTV
jgi:hypothetical protein